jgi:spore germination cell wall hydrolase CwlJ-like protein
MRLIPDATWATMTIWQEARGESFDGMVAVAEVILRRTMKKMFSDGTVASTVLWPYQFSGWNTKDPNRIPVAKLDDTDRIVTACMRAWQEALEGSNLTKGATHYFAPAIVNPEWASRMTVTARIGRHVFLKEEAA